MGNYFIDFVGNRACEISILQLEATRDSVNSNYSDWLFAKSLLVRRTIEILSSSYATKGNMRTHNYHSIASHEHQLEISFPNGT